jgi:PPOX class probable FMN-dependent enzyme
MDKDYTIRDATALRELYGTPHDASIAKQVDYLHPLYQEFIRASPFLILATAGQDGLDTSPRGDAPGFVAIEDERTLLLPDRRGNNRVDCLINITHDPRVSLIFLIPGINETLRVTGSAEISTRPDLLARFTANGKPPRTVVIVHVREVFFQCAKALMRSELWDPSRYLSRASLPSNGTILSTLTQERIDAVEFDRLAPAGLRDTLY